MHVDEDGVNFDNSDIFTAQKKEKGRRFSGDTNHLQLAAIYLVPSLLGHMGVPVLVYRGRLCPLAGLILRAIVLQILHSLFSREMPPCCIISGLPQQCKASCVPFLAKRMKMSRL